MKKFWKGLLLILGFLVILGLIYGAIYLYRTVNTNHRDEICDILNCKKTRLVWVDIAPKNSIDSYSLEQESSYKDAVAKGHILIERCSEHYPIHPQKSEEWHIKAHVYMRKGEVHNALAVLEEAAKIKPSWKFYGTTLLKEAQLLKEALQFTEKLVQENPNQAGLWIEFARIQALLQQKEAMLVSLKKGIQLEKGYCESILRLTEFKSYLEDPELVALLKGK